MAEGSEKRGFAALVEQVRSEVRTVAEGHGGLVHGQEELRNMIASLGTRVNFIENAMTDGFKEVREIKGMVTEIKDRTALLNTQLDAHEQSHLS